MGKSGYQDLRLTPYPASRCFARQLLLFTLPLLLGRVAFGGADQPGVKVVSVGKESAAARAGLQVGDVVSGWVQDRTRGVISDPFYFDFVAQERAPRGPVTLNGFRGGKAASWTIANDDWKTKTIPASPEAQAVMDRLNDLAKAKRFTDLDAYCRQACSTLDAQSAARTFALFEAGRLLGGSNQLPQAAFFFNQSLENRPRKSDWIAVDIYSNWADLCEKFHDWSSAESLYKKGLEEAGRLNPRSLLMGLYLEDLGILKFETGKLRESQRFYARALEVIHALAPESVAVTSLLGQIGAAAGEAGDLDLSESYFKKQLALAIKLNMSDRYVARIYNILSVPLELERISQAEKYSCMLLQPWLTEPGSNVSSFQPLRANIQDLARHQATYREPSTICDAPSRCTKHGAAGEFDLAYDLATLASSNWMAGIRQAAIQWRRRVHGQSYRAAPFPTPETGRRTALPIATLCASKVDGSGARR